MALANGLWVGNVPKELSDLTFVERLLVARVRSNRCIVHVLKGGWKMRANAIMFPSPVPKLCNILPPPVEELDDVIAFMFTGVCPAHRRGYEANTDVSTPKIYISSS
jgi:hypothetical protein